MTIHLRTWGDLACFTRPEMKDERVSYPVIPAFLEMVFDQPQPICAN